MHARFRFGRLILFGICVIFLTACGTSRGTTTPRLRLMNTSNTTFEQLTVRFPTTDIDFGRVEAGATTEYLRIPTGVYRYAAYQFTIDGTSFDQSVADFTGETPINGTTFTYILTLIDEETGVFVQADVRRD